MEVRILIFLLSAKKKYQKAIHLSLYLQNRHDEFHKKYYWGKNCTPITTGNTIIGLLYSIMQVTYEDHGAKKAKFKKKIFKN